MRLRSGTSSTTTAHRGRGAEADPPATSPPRVDLRRRRRDRRPGRIVAPVRSHRGGDSWDVVDSGEPDHGGSRRREGTGLRRARRARTRWLSTKITAETIEDADGRIEAGPGPPPTVPGSALDRRRALPAPSAEPPEAAGPSDPLFDNGAPSTVVLSIGGRRPTVAPQRRVDRPGVTGRARLGRSTGGRVQGAHLPGRRSMVTLPADNPRQL